MSSSVETGTPVPLATQEQLLLEVQQLQTTDLYRKALTFNVILKYDPKIKHLITHTYYSTIYKYHTKEENWVKLEVEGVLSLYSRDVALPQTTVTKADIIAKELYTFGLIILNKLSLENFSIGLISNSNIVESDKNGMKLELLDGLIILKNLIDETFGIWIHDEKIRNDFYKSLQYIIEN